MPPGLRLLGCLTILCLSQASAAGTIYRWIDDSGTVNFSEEPPPAELVKEYDEISGELRAIHIRVDKYPDQTTDDLSGKKPAKSAPVETDKARDPVLRKQSSEALIRKNYCTNLARQIEKLEARMAQMEDTGQLDRVMLTIHSYEDSFSERCD